MLFGKLIVDREHGAIHTGRDSYLLDTLTAVSVRRPLLPGCAVSAGGLSSFSIAFGDLLHPAEIATIATLTVGLVSVGLSLGRLSLISRDLRGSVFAGALWGWTGTLHRLRAEIVAAMITIRRT